VKKSVLWADILLNATVILSVTVAVFGYFIMFDRLFINMGVYCFRFFTTDSNIMAAVACAFVIFYDVRALRHPEKAIPMWVIRFKFLSAVAVSLTFLTVLCFLGPMFAISAGWRGFFFMYEKNSFVLHFFAPLLTVISFAALEKGTPLRRRACLWGILPTLVYGVIYIAMVYRGVWTDFYGLTFGGQWKIAPLSFAAMLLVSFGLAALIRLLRAKQKEMTP